MKLPTWLVLLCWILAASVGNTVLNVVDRLLGLPFFFDSLFTAVGAGVLGWIPGLLIATLTQLLISVTLLFIEQQQWGLALPFVLCQFETVLVIGLMVRFGSLRTILSLIVAIFAVALGNSVLGSMIATFLYGGITLHGADFLVAGLLMGGQSLFEAAFWARVPINLVDKAIAVVLAYFAVQRWGGAFAVNR
jgi:energy-coupling factor transport system substrate-specific component